MIVQKNLISKEMFKQANQDIAKRSLTGAYIYLLIWFALIIPNEFYISGPESCLIFTLVFIVCAAVRVAMILNFDKIYDYSPKFWIITFTPVIWAPALAWGVLCALSFINPLYQEMALVIVIATGGLTGGGVIALLPSRVMAFGLVSSFLVPGIIVLFMHSEFDLSLKLVFVLYWMGMINVTRTPFKTYWSNLKHSHLIEKHAAELERINKLDGLTGLNNRSYFDQHLTKELKKAIRTKTALTLILVDIDHFKKINDQHGHLVGDDCLRRVAKQLRDSVKRETDIVARYGGEEFAIILPGNNREQGLQLADKIRLAIEKLDPEYGQVSCPLTVSLGLATIIPKDTDTEESIIEMADTALYRAKANGRNQVAE